jgi:L-fuconolactonase
MIDAQVHVYERNHPGRPWVDALPGPIQVTGDLQVAMMDSLGIQGALLVSPWALYRTDTSYMVDVHRQFPDRFRMIAPVDPHQRDVEEVIEEWSMTSGAVGLRMMANTTEALAATDPRVRRALLAATRLNLPVCLYCSGNLSVVDELARLFPEVQLIIDHLGLIQPTVSPAPLDPFAELDSVLALAIYSNIAIKLTGAFTLSQQKFPFADTWSPMKRVVDAFGVERCMWGSDWTRATNLLTYEQCIQAIRTWSALSATEQSDLTGGTAQHVFGWEMGIQPAAGFNRRSQF